MLETVRHRADIVDLFRCVAQGSDEIRIRGIAVISEIAPESRDSSLTSRVYIDGGFLFVALDRTRA